MTIEAIRDAIMPYLVSQGASRVGIFGSAARGEMNQNSDVDILIDIKKDISLFEFIGIQQSLEEKLGRKVDLVEYEAIKPALKKNILESQVVFL